MGWRDAGRGLGRGEPSPVISLVWWHSLPRSCFSYIPGRTSVTCVSYIWAVNSSAAVLSNSLLSQRHSSTCPTAKSPQVIRSPTPTQNIHTFQSYPCLRCLSPTSTSFTAHSHPRDALAQPAVVLPARHHWRQRWRCPLLPPSARPGPRPGGAYRRASPLQLLLTAVS